LRHHREHQRRDILAEGPKRITHRSYAPARISIRLGMGRDQDTIGFAYYIYCFLKIVIAYHKQILCNPKGALGTLDMP